MTILKTGGKMEVRRWKTKNDARKRRGSKTAEQETDEDCDVRKEKMKKGGNKGDEGWMKWDWTGKRRFCFYFVLLIIYIN